MPAFSPSRMLLGAVASLAVALSGWYGVRTASRAPDLPAARNSPALSVAVEAADALAPERGEKDGPGWAEVAALRETISRLSGDLTALRHQYQQHADQLSALRHQVHAPAPSRGTRRAPVPRSPVPPSSDREDPTATAVTDPAAAEAQEAALRQAEHERSLRRAQANALEFNAQAVDTVWATEADSLLQDALARAALQGTQLGGVECRTTLCWVEVTHEDPEQRAHFEQYLPLLVAPLLPRIALHTTENGDGSSRTVLYLAREGVPLPQDHEGN